MEGTQFDKKLIIHVAAEVVIIAGITFWLNSKISGRDATIEKLEKENKELAARLQKIENFLINATGGQPPQSPPIDNPIPNPSKKKKKKKSQSPTASEESIILSSEDKEIEV